MPASRGSFALSCRRRYPKRLSYQRRERSDEGWIVVERLDPVELEPELGGTLSRLDIEVPEDLEVVGDEPDRTDEHALDAARVQRVELLHDVRPEPRLPGRARALERERPALEPRPLGHELRRLQQLLLVGIAEREDPLGQRVGREDDVRVRSADTIRDDVEERLVVVPVLDETELG